MKASLVVEQRVLATGGRLAIGRRLAVILIVLSSSLLSTVALLAQPFAAGNLPLGATFLH
jgi:hypothetical protein